ncbi:MAG: heme exporter protein CcmB [Acetobacteraceae bacterium]|nr:heme exporter protein CcmB [Acetobacteraceae bacterium]
MAAHRAQGGIVIAATHVPLPIENAQVLRLRNTLGDDRRGDIPDAPAAGSAPPNPLPQGEGENSFYFRFKFGLPGGPSPQRKGEDPTSVRVALAALWREVQLSLRHGSDTLAAILFFLLTALLFPLAIGPAPETLGRLAPGIVWVCALLSALLPLDRLFGADMEDGSLDQLMLCGLAPAVLSAMKAAAHWLVTGLPLLIAAAPLAIMLRIPEQALPVLLVGLAPGTLLLSLIGTTGAAVVLGARRGGVLLPLLVLPLSLPVLIFGVAAVDAGSAGLSPRPHLFLLAAIFAAGLPLFPVASGAALRNAAG